MQLKNEEDENEDDRSDDDDDDAYKHVFGQVLSKELIYFNVPEK